jgi:hypothetical protein
MVFRMLDSNADGVLDQAELAQVFRLLQMPIKGHAPALVCAPSGVSRRSLSVCSLRCIPALFVRVLPPVYPGALCPSGGPLSSN